MDNVKHTKEEKESFLKQIKSFFNIFGKSNIKNIQRIRVMNGTQKFWVSDPIKIKFWKNLARSNSLFGFDKGFDASIKITKIIYFE